MQIGIRELKAKLSEYLGAVQRGEEVIVTDRGRPIVRLVPFADTTLQVGFDEGWIEAPRRRSLSDPPLLCSDRSILDVLDDDRGL